MNFNKNENHEKTDKKIYEFLKNNCFSVKHKGTLYLKYAFGLLGTDESLILNLKKNVYMEIGEYYTTGYDSVERDISFAIKKAFKKSREEKTDSCFSCFKSAPTNGEFIKTFYDSF